jgi:hypothetical protein
VRRGSLDVAYATVEVPVARRSTAVPQHTTASNVRQPGGERWRDRQERLDGKPAPQVPREEGVGTGGGKCVSFNRMYRYVRIGCPPPAFEPGTPGGGKHEAFTGVPCAGAQLCPSTSPA